jgi:mannose/cellobiose epimerase-like protein (N-acyl-D-glucosamine 2-epimerase family)
VISAKRAKVDDRHDGRPARCFCKISHTNTRVMQEKKQSRKCVVHTRMLYERASASRRFPTGLLEDTELGVEYHKMKSDANGPQYWRKLTTGRECS